jgi:hypothetical protein
MTSTKSEISIYTNPAIWQALIHSSYQNQCSFFASLCIWQLCRPGTGAPFYAFYSTRRKSVIFEPVLLFKLAKKEFMSHATFI